MKRIRRFVEWWWHLVWVKRLGLDVDPFAEEMISLKDRLFVIEKRCSALTPTPPREWEDQ